MVQSITMMDKKGNTIITWSPGSLEIGKAYYGLKVIGGNRYLVLCSSTTGPAAFDVYYMKSKHGTMARGGARTNLLLKLKPTIFSTFNTASWAGITYNKKNIIVTFTTKILGPEGWLYTGYIYESDWNGNLIRSTSIPVTLDKIDTDGVHYYGSYISSGYVYVLNKDFYPIRLLVLASDSKGIAVDGKNIWSVSSTTVYKYDLNGKLITSFVVGSEYYDISTDGKYLYLIN